MQWQWRNDPDGLHEDDLARCITAPGERLLVHGVQLFKMTTQASSGVAEHCDAPACGPQEVLQLEYAGIGWAHGCIVRFWRSWPFARGPLGDKTKQAAGLALLATVAAELALA
jgi:hypothetical protein